MEKAVPHTNFISRMEPSKLNANKLKIGRGDPGLFFSSIFQARLNLARLNSENKAAQHERFAPTANILGILLRRHVQL
jgi:hypothetical protein